MPAMKRTVSEIQIDLGKSQKKSRGLLATYQRNFDDLDKNYMQYKTLVKAGTRDNYDHQYYVENYTDVYTECTKPMSDHISELVGSGHLPEAYDSEFDGEIADVMDYFKQIVYGASSPSKDLVVCINTIFDKFTSIINDVPSYSNTPVAMWTDLTPTQKKAVANALIAEGHETHSDEFLSLMQEYRQTGIPSNSAAADVL